MALKPDAKPWTVLEQIGAGTNVRDDCSVGWITDVEVEPTGEGSISKFPCSRKEFEEDNDG